MLTVAAAGCDGPDPESASRNLARSFADSVAAQSDTTGAGTAADSLPNCPLDSQMVAGKGAKLYLDASESMAGFVAGDAITEFENRLDRLASRLGISEVYLFGELAGGVGSYLEAQRMRPGFPSEGTFTRVHNPDYCLFRAIAAAGSSPHLYFTDGVQSAARYGVPSPAAVALQRWLAQGHSLAIVAYRSRFTGRAWSEQLRKWIGRVDVDDRPFYVFVLTASPSSMDQLLDRLAPEGSEMVLQFSADPVTCQVRAAGHFQQRSDDPPWGVLDPPIQDRLTDDPGKIGELHCDYDTGFPLRQVLGRTEVSYRTWGGGEGRFGARESPPDGASFSVDTPVGEGSGFQIRAQIPNDPSTQYGLYHLRIRVRPGTLPKNIQELSADSDARAGDYSRTYRFSWLVENLVQWQVARSVPDRAFSLLVED